LVYELGIIIIWMDRFIVEYNVIVYGWMIVEMRLDDKDYVHTNLMYWNRFIIMIIVMFNYAYRY
jgi:hypothetical protein